MKFLRCFVLELHYMFLMLFKLENMSEGNNIFRAIAIPKLNDFRVSRFILRNRSTKWNNSVL